MPCGGLNNIEVTIQIANENCPRTMNWYFDRPLGVEWIVWNIKENLEVRLINDLDFQNDNKFSYRLLNIMYNEIQRGSIKSLNEINGLENKTDLQPGLYILQIIHNEMVVKQTKFVKNY